MVSLTMVIPDSTRAAVLRALDEDRLSLDEAREVLESFGPRRTWPADLLDRIPDEAVL